jgi:hypothetical protein
MRLMEEESLLDSFLVRVPDLGSICRLVQTVRESDVVRLNLKRAMVLVEIHRAHHVDLDWADTETLGLSRVDCRVLCDAMEEHVDKFLWGTTTHEDLVDRCTRLYETLSSLEKRTERHEVVRRVAESHRTGRLAGIFDTAFIRRLVAIIPSPKTQTLQT